jgi:hypothetical protein
VTRSEGANEDANVSPFRLSEMIRGWFVGAFEPSAFHTEDFEVGVQHFPAGHVESMHHHKVCTEITVLVAGRARMCGRELVSGDILVLSPFTATTFEALEDTITTVVKVPCVPGDKYPGEPQVGSLQ